MNKERYAAIVAAALWTIASVIVFFLPGHLVPGSGGVPDWAIHFTVFIGAAWLWLRVFPSHVVLVGLACIAAALGTEAVQEFVVGQRGAELADVVADVVGLAVGLLLARARRGTPVETG